MTFPSGLSPTTLQALAKLVNAHAVNTALVALVSYSSFIRWPLTNSEKKTLNFLGYNHTTER